MGLGWGWVGSGWGAKTKTSSEGLNWRPLRVGGSAIGGSKHLKACGLMVLPKCGVHGTSPVKG